MSLNCRASLIDYPRWKRLPSTHRSWVSMFIALLALPASVLRAEIYFYEAAKTVTYTQTSNVPPTAPENWYFTASLLYDVPDEVLTANIEFDVPPPASYAMSRASTNLHLYYSPFYATESELDGAYPSTSYTFDVDRGVGPESADVFLPAGLYPAQLPAFTLDSYDRLQAYDASLPFHLTFSSFVPNAGTNIASTAVAIAEENVGGVFSLSFTPGQFEVVIPANVLEPDTNYSISVAHSNSAETMNAGFDSANSYASFARGTSVYFRTLPSVDADFNDDGLLDCADVDALVLEIATGTQNPAYDLTADAVVDINDLDQWRVDAGAVNLPSMNPFLRGDANLDGVVDGSDFNIWNSHKFTSLAAWCSGDFNADGVVDGSDFSLWNANKFSSADGAGVVPEPALGLSLLLALGLALRSRLQGP